MFTQPSLESLLPLPGKQTTALLPGVLLTQPAQSWNLALPFQLVKPSDFTGLQIADPSVAIRCSLIPHVLDQSVTHGELFLDLTTNSSTPIKTQKSQVQEERLYSVSLETWLQEIPSVKIMPSNVEKRTLSPGFQDKIVVNGPWRLTTTAPSIKNQNQHQKHQPKKRKRATTPPSLPSHPSSPPPPCSPPCSDYSVGNKRLKHETY